MNPIIISTIIGAASFILTIFSALYLNQQHINKLMEAFRYEVGAKLDGVGAKIDGLESKMDVRFETVNARLDQMDKRIDRIERQFDTLFKLPKAS